MTFTRLSLLASRWLTGLLLMVTALPSVQADVSVPNIFSSHMVLQRAQKNRVWGKASPGEDVTVKIHQQTHTAKADAAGAWQVTLDPLPVGGPYEMTIKGQNEVKLEDILVGEVWICSGQSNMQWSINASNDPDLEKLAAKYPNLRMINFPQVGAQEPIWTHERYWQVCTPENVGGFSAVGYFFGRQLHQTLDVPVGMINNAWGGSACEAWVSRDLLAADPLYKPMLDRWDGIAKSYEELAKNKDSATKEAAQQLKALENQLKGQGRPSNIYNGVLKSHMGYGIKGAIWYQGESNAGRAYQYRELFPLMISSWRKEWNQGDFPFYWVQLADFMAEKPEPSDSTWAELREAQTMTMSKLAKTGEAVIIDIGEGKDIHPKNKVDVGRRLARWALANEYDIKIAYRSPQYKSMEKNGDKIVLTFDHLEQGWRPFDVATPVGFTSAGEDKKFYKADAKIVAGNAIEVSCASVPSPVAVRYAWADNPVCNMFSGAGLPLTPFRTDDWPGITKDAK
ncbi:MAG: sialate O-acetylesterase [Pirellulaceae bacterium]|nr:sialate O-acetylesterase [Pirellulaceae bacterium]